MGLSLSRGTMARLVIRVAKALRPVMECLDRDIRGSPVLGMDETGVQVLKEPGRSPEQQSYMWVARGFYIPDKPEAKSMPLIRFAYHDSRSGNVAEAMVGTGFSGYLQTDGYGGYSKIGRRPGIDHVGCWAHIRREFHRLYVSNTKSTLAAQVLNLIRRLYTIERKHRQALDDKTITQEEFLEQRKTATQPVFEEILTWLHDHQNAVLPQGNLGKAISYALGQYRRAIRYVDHWLLTPDNNAVERAIRPFVIGRKNWQFIDTQAGAMASACLYSLIETAKANGHEPYRYLCFLFATLPPVASDAAAVSRLLPYRLDPKAY